MKTSEIKAALRRHYKTTEYALMFEVGNATGTQVRRHADAVVMNLWPSRGLQIEGIEIKVSRSDWRREIENPAKAEEVAKFCDRWWVIAPVGIVQAHELPLTWGHMTVNDKGRIQVVKPAPKMEPVPLTRGFVAAMLRRASEADQAQIDALVQASIAPQLAQLDKRVESAVQRATRDYDKIRDKAEELRKQGLNLFSYESALDIIRYYTLGKQVSETHALGRLDFYADTLEKAAASLREVNRNFAGNVE